MNKMLQLEYIETERLRLRVLYPGQYNYVFANYSDTELKAFFDFDNESLEKERFKYQNGMTTYRMSFCIFHLMEKESMKIIADASLHNWYAIHARAELGYAMRKEEYKNKGYMREAAPAIVEYGFEKMNLNRIEAFIATYNMPSQKVVQRLGFVQEGLLREHYFANDQNEDSLLFGLLKKDYKSSESSEN